jgi:hypothetical protein
MRIGIRLPSNLLLQRILSLPRFEHQDPIAPLAAYGLLRFTSYGNCSKQDRPRFLTGIW